MPIQLPADELTFAHATTPSYAATIGVPVGAGISRPLWNSCPPALGLLVSGAVRYPKSDDILVYPGTGHFIIPPSYVGDEVEPPCCAATCFLRSSSSFLFLSISSNS